jgi:hypothetical protein
MKNLTWENNFNITATIKKNPNKNNRLEGERWKGTHNGQGLEDKGEKN